MLLGNEEDEFGFHAIRIAVKITPGTSGVFSWGRMAEFAFGVATEVRMCASDPVATTKSSK